MSSKGNEKLTGPSAGTLSDRTDLVSSTAIATTLGLLPMLAFSASFSDQALAQQAAEPAPELPPLVVETKAKKKQTVAKKKAAPSSPTPIAAPAVDPVAERPQTPPLPGQAGPVGPGEYKADYATSNKFTGPLLDTPQTVTVIPGTIIAERGATNLTQALRNTPGITFDAGENGFATSTNNFKLRGFDTSGSIFVDGVRNSGSFARDMFNVEQVEVVKGAAADNGRGAAAGYVNIITKTPLEENFVRGDTSLTFDEHGTDALFRSTVDINQRIGTVAVRMNGMYENGGVMGRDVAELDAYGLAPSITFGVGTDTRATFAYERLSRDDVPDWGVPGVSVKGLWLSNPVATGAARDNFYGLASDFDKVTGDRFMARLEHDISSNVKITNQTVWESADRNSRYVLPTGYEPPLTIPGFVPGLVNAQVQFYDRENTMFSNQTNLSARFSTGSIGHTISTGVEVTREQSDANRYGTINCTNNAGTNYVNGALCTDIFNPNPNRFVPPAFPPTQTNSIEIETVAGYLYDTIALTRQLELSGGLRVEHYNVRIDSALFGGTPTGFGGTGKFEDSETTLGGKIGLAYKPVDNGTIYAAYGVSALPPGSYLSNPDISRPDDNAFPGLVPGADPVEIHNYEVGIKWDFLGGKLSTTAAAFQTEKRDVAYGGSVGFPGIAYGDQIVRGIELGIAGELTDRWKVFGGVLWLDSEREHGSDVDQAAIAANSGDYGPSGSPAWVAANPSGVTTTNGDELSGVPHFSATLWTTYDVTDKLTFGGGVQYVGEAFLGRPDDALRLIPNGKYGKLPDYFLVNFMASYDLTDNVALQLNIDNLFDEEYAISSNWSASRATLGAPRTFRLGTSFDF